MPSDVESFSLLQDTPPTEQIAKKPRVRRAAPPDFNRIRCPKCSWRPRASDRWLCWDCGEPEFFMGGCGNSWNTFTTRGLCPGCQHQWRWTTCLRCQQWSLHEDWYADDSGSTGA